VWTEAVLGCDGANSTTRTSIGTAMQNLGFQQQWLVVDVHSHQPLDLYDGVQQVCHHDRAATFMMVTPGRYRWEFRLRAGEQPDHLDQAQIVELIRPWLGSADPNKLTMLRRTGYTFRGAIAQRWRDGRVFLLGDAAHLTPPFIGQGMCAGIRDAANLAWKLDLVIAGLADDTLLDTYQHERLPSARRAIEFSMELGKVICVPDPDEAAARDEVMAAAVGAEPTQAPPLPGLDAGFVHPSAPHAGELFVQGTVDGKRFDDVRGTGWRLVTVDLDRHQIDPSLRAWFETIGGHVVPLAPPDAVYGCWFAERDTAAALQRPDFHLYGTATTAAGASALLDDLRHRLTTPLPTLQGASA
jgi:3-(3-hydroxy-phenyl)propionate hydroxylase